MRGSRSADAGGAGGGGQVSRSCTPGSGVPFPPAPAPAPTACDPSSVGVATVPGVGGPPGYRPPSWVGELTGTGVAGCGGDRRDGGSGIANPTWRVAGRALPEPEPSAGFIPEPPYRAGNTRGASGRKGEDTQANDDSRKTNQTKTNRRTGRGSSSGSDNHNRHKEGGRGDGPELGVETRYQENRRWKCRNWWCVDEIESARGLDGL